MPHNIVDFSPGVNRQGRDFPRTGRTASAGFVKAPYAVTGMRGLSDAGFRLWDALQQFSWRGAMPTNDQLAEACGWASTAKVKRVLRQLVSAELVERRVEVVDGRNVRTVLAPIGVATVGPGPQALPACGSNPTREGIKSGPPDGSNPSHGGGSNPDRSVDRCRQMLPDAPRSDGDGEGSPRTTTTGPATAVGQAPILPPPDAVPAAGAGRRFLERLPSGLRAVFEAETPRSRASILKRFELGADFDVVFSDAVELLERRARVASSPPPMITSPAQDPRSLMQAAASGDPLAPIHLAQRLVLDFGGDHKSRRAFEKLGKDLLTGMRTVDEVWHAYSKATGPAARNPGAIFNVELRSNASSR